MLLLNRKTEYAMIALRHLAVHRPSAATLSVQSIADRFHLPVILLSKIMQQLKHLGYVQSKKGRSGGYVLSSELADISFVDFLAQMGETVEMVSCVEVGGKMCAQFEVCEIKAPIAGVQKVVLDAMSSISLEDALGVPPSDSVAA